MALSLESNRDCRNRRVMASYPSRNVRFSLVMAALWFSCENPQKVLLQNWHISDTSKASDSEERKHIVEQKLNQAWKWGRRCSYNVGEIDFFLVMNGHYPWMSSIYLQWTTIWKFCFLCVLKTKVHFLVHIFFCKITQGRNTWAILTPFFLNGGGFLLLLILHLSVSALELPLVSKGVYLAFGFQGKQMMVRYLDRLTLVVWSMQTMQTPPQILQLSLVQMQFCPPNWC